jgi:hypothetical protein
MDRFWSLWNESILSDSGFTYWVGWWSALICFLVSFYAAKRIWNQPRLFTALALFAGAWVLMMSAIAARMQIPKETALPDRAFDVASFLFVFAGAILAREAPPDHRANRAQRWVQLAGLWLLFFLVLPDRIPIKIPQLSTQQTDLIVGELLTLAGFVSLGLGAHAVARAGMFWVLVAILGVYECLSLSRTVELIAVLPGADRPPLKAQVLYSIIVARFFLTGMLCYVVLVHARALPTTLDQPAPTEGAPTRV